MELSPITIAVIAAYLIILVGIGLYSVRHVKSMRDYMIAGQGLGRWIASFGIVASIISGAAMLGNAGAGYGSGYALYVMTMGLSFLGLTLAYFVLAKPMVIIARRHSVYTLPDVLALRYGDSNAVRSLSAVAVTLGSFVYLVVQFVAIGWVGTTIFGLSQPMALLLGGGLIVLYTVGGGIVAAMWTNFFQMLVLGGLAVFTAFYFVTEIGGLAELHQSVANIDPELIAPWHESGAFVWQNTVVYAFFVGLLAYAGVPHINTKFLMVRNLEILRWMPLISCGLYLIGNATLWVGMSYRVIEADGRLPSPAEPDAVFPLLIAETFGPFLVGVMVAAVLSAVLSTTESFMIAGAAAIVRDIVKNSFGLPMSDRTELNATRVLGVLLLVGAGFIALSPPDFVLALMAVAWGALAAMLGPVLYVGLRWRRATTPGAVASLVAGIVVGGVIGILNQTVFANDPLFAPWNVAAIGVIVSYAAIFTVSKATPPTASRMFSHFVDSGPAEVAVERSGATRGA